MLADTLIKLYQQQQRENSNFCTVKIRPTIPINCINILSNFIFFQEPIKHVLQEHLAIKSKQHIQQLIVSFHAGKFLKRQATLNIYAKETLTSKSGEKKTIISE